MPAWADECPDLSEGDQFFMRAFWDLTTERQVGFSMGQIPDSRIDEYGRRKGLDSGSMDLFRAVIRMLDDAYLKWVADEQKKARDRAKPDG